MPKYRVCSKCGRNRQEKFYTSPRGRVCSDCRRATRRAASRSHRLGQTYGITLEEYDQLLAAQGGACAICGGTRNYALHVDHDHALERELGDSRASVRGLICARENKALARLGDDADLLRAMADYLDNPPARDVLGTRREQNYGL